MIDMKNLLLIICTLITIQSASQTIEPAAQITFGLKTGLSLSNYSASYHPPHSPGTAIRPAFIFGGYIDILLSKNLYLRPEAITLMKGAYEKASENGVSYKISRNYRTIDFPVDIIYKTKRAGQQRLLFGAGVAPGIILNNYNYGVFNKGDFGLNILSGYEFPIGLSFNLNYTYGLVNITTATNPDFKSLKSRYLGITLGYFF